MIFLTSPKLLQRGFGKGVFENNSEGSFETKLPRKNAIQDAKSKKNELWGPKNNIKQVNYGNIGNQSSSSIGPRDRLTREVSHGAAPQQQQQDEEDNYGIDNEIKNR